MTSFSRGFALALLGAGFCGGLAGCQEDNESTAAKAQTGGGSAPATPGPQFKTQEEYFKQQQGQMKKMPGYNAAKAEKAQNPGK
jgi:hypothetical protein